jgi:hypothetical protein
MFSARFTSDLISTSPTQRCLEARLVTAIKRKRAIISIDVIAVIEKEFGYKNISGRTKSCVIKKYFQVNLAADSEPEGTRTICLL